MLAQLACARMRSLLVLMLAVPVLVAAGCGGGSDTTAPVATPVSKPMKLDAPPPVALRGTYTTTLERADLPADPRPELRGGRAWLMKITRRGGVGDAPSLVLMQPSDDPMEISTVSAAGPDTLKVSNQRCAPYERGGRYTFVTSTYRWRLEGDTLRLRTVKPGCPDKVADTILTSRAWKKQG